MKITRRIGIFLILILVIEMLELLHIGHVERTRNRQVLEFQLQEKRKIIDKSLRSLYEELESRALAVSRLQVIRDFLEGKRVRMPSDSEILDDPVRGVRIDAYWIFRADMSLVRTAGTAVADLYDRMGLPLQDMKKILNGHSLRRFFTGNNGKPWEMCSVPVWSSKKDQSPKISGFVMIGKIWDETYLSEISAIIGAEAHLIFPGKKSENEPAGIITIGTLKKPLLAWNGTVTAEIVFTPDFPVYKKLSGSVNRIVIVFLLFMLLLFVLLGVFLRSQVVKPLKLLTASLDRQDHRLIEPLIRQKSEFGHLGQNILNFFKQKESLLMEIRDRQKMEQKLKSKEEKYRNLIEVQGEGVVVLDSNEYFLFSNPAAEKMFGVFPERLIGYNLKEFLAADQFANVQQQTRLRSMGRKTSYEMLISRSDSEKRWIFVNATPQFEADGTLNSFEIFVDITDRKNAEIALQESESKFRRLAESINAGIFILQNETFRYVNSFFEAISGYPRLKLLKTKYPDIIHPDYIETVQQQIDQVRKAKGEEKTPIRQEIKIVNRNGEEFWVDFYLTSIDFFKGKAILGTIFDISERKRMEEEIIKTQKLESVAQLAGGIAHDFNNYLTAILGNISLARVKADYESELGRTLEKAENATLRARDLSQQLLTFSRGGDPVKRTVELARLIEETTEFVLSGSRLKARIFIESPLWAVEADESQISQVFNNLIINSMDAMPEGGLIEIKAENQLVSTPEWINDMHFENDLNQSQIDFPAKFIKISFQDHGLGIDSKDLGKIFDPYFSTKKGGAGLGLAVVYSIIRKHGGAIHVESEPGQGTVFYIWLPATEMDPKEITGETKAIFHGQGRILLMDDEEFILEVGTELLQYLGYEVMVARNGDEAVILFREHQENDTPFAAVIMDLTIPGGMGGKEAMKRLQEIDPQIPVIVSSGYSNDPVMADFRQFGFSGIVAKPYRIETLSEVLQSVLGKSE